MGYSPRPHVSNALQHLRVSIAAASLVLGACLVGQVVMWALVHFTEVQTTRLRAPQSPSNTTVVAKPVETESLASATTKKTEVGGETSPADVNVVPSKEGAVIRRAGALIQTFGIISALVLLVMMLQAVAVAGGASVPGVEMAVTATTWVLIVCAASVPLNGLIPNLTYPGVFIAFDELVRVSQEFRRGVPGSPGTLGFYGMHLLLPFLLIAGLIAAILRFRAGVEQGVIVTSVSQLDEKLEKEIRAMKLGQLAAPRSVGALNAAIGDNGDTGGKFGRPVSEEVPPGVRPLSAPSPGSGERRPI